MKIVGKHEDGKRTIYTVEICNNRYVDVMYIKESYLCYAMQEHDGRIVFDDNRNTFDCEIDEMVIVMFVRRYANST